MVVGIAATVPIVVYVATAPARLRYPYDLHWMEGSSVDIARRVSLAEPLYTAPTLDFVSWPYPPLYYWVAGGLSWIIGPGYLPLRLVSLAAALAVLGLVAVIVTRRTGHALAGLVAAGAYAGTFQLSGSWADIGRVDSLMLALLLAGVVAAQRASTIRHGLLVGLLLGAAVMTKQNAVLVALPLLAVTGWRHRRVLWSAVPAFVAAVLVPSAIEQWRSDGWYAEVVGLQLLGHGVAADRILGFWPADVVAPLAGLVLVVSWATVARRRQTGAGGWRAVAGDVELVACVGLLLIAWSGRLHDGGFRNVLMPAYAAVAILTGLALAWLWADGRLRGRRPAGVVAAVLAIQLGLLSLPWLPLVPTEADRVAGDAFVQAVAATPGRVVVLGHPWYAELAGKGTSAHVIGLTDVATGGSARARDALASALPPGLAGVDVVILDEVGDGALLQPGLDRDFVQVSAAAVSGDGFWPISDLRRRPTYVYVRRTAGPEVAAPWR